ncbi:response regulator [Paenibacillus glycanilyticus]|uniref:DNA-binding response regulator n=1 Tax=Paenibacillus glycanilyticus TaxID=126569 RepID=A0ABQ6GBE8_9BACL|nr:response regulator [Paenibacillus glycanilyticus]GLX66992.1 DNA-binding response regulator [Paenibacillus glycanilyticus]
MHNVLIVDDQQLEITGLRTFIPWEKLNLQLVAEANDGFTALDYIEELAPDIVITDIKMPIMSGLELARRTKLIKPSIIFIFISGYEDFEYAKKAIQFSVEGYILKPINYNELIETLGNAVTRIERERNFAQLKDQWDASQHIVKNNAVKQLLEGESDAGYLNDVKLRYQAVYWRAAILELDDVDRRLNSLEPNENQQQIKSTMSYLTTYLQQENVLYAALENKRLGIVIPETSSQETMQRLEQLIEDARRHSAFTITVGLGNSVPELHELRKSYGEANQALGQKMFNGKGRILPFASTQLNLESSQQILGSAEELLSQLFYAIQNYQLVDIYDLLEQLGNLILKLDSRNSVYHFTIYVFGKVNDFLNEKNENIYDLLQWDFQHLAVIYQFETVQDLRDWLRRQMFQVSELLHNKLAKRNKKLIEKVEQHVLEHLEEGVTLKDLAKQFLYSPNHLGQMFKEETSMHFSDYILNLRLERVKQLLDDPTMKIYDAADRLGFKNMTHFYRLFKKKFGVSPGDYRKKG